MILKLWNAAFQEPTLKVLTLTGTGVIAQHVKLPLEMSTLLIVVDSYHCFPSWFLLMHSRSITGQLKCLVHRHPLGNTWNSRLSFCLHFPMWVTGSQTFGPSSNFLEPLAGSCIRMEQPGQEPGCQAYREWLYSPHHSAGPLKLFLCQKFSTSRSSCCKEECTN